VGTRRRWSLAAVVAVPVVVALVVGALALRSGRDGDGPEVRSPETVDLEATDAVAVGSIDDLVDAAECVVLGEVVSTERGRAVTAGLVSRLVQVRIDEALAGGCPTGTVVLEEEGWLEDGTEVSVEGWPGSMAGDEGVWFLVAGTSDEMPYAATVATTGAVRWRGGEPLAPATAPAWLLVAVEDGPDGLAEQVRAAS
jgi:hypothetical protein